MGNWTDFILQASVISAAAQLIYTVTSTVRARRESRRALELTREDEFQRALDSDDLVTLGKYIDEYLGGVNLDEYGRNREVAARVDRYLSRIQAYVGTKAELESAPTIADITVPVGDATDEISPVPNTTAEMLPADIRPEVRAFLSPVVEEYNQARIWNALARLRRDLEQVFRVLTQDLHFVQRDGSAGKLLWALERHQAIDRAWAKGMYQVLDICNRAIHGVDVPADAAAWAIRQAAILLDQSSIDLRAIEVRK